jgi:hypothetical protein
LLDLEAIHHAELCWMHCFFSVVLIGVALRGCVVAWATINSSFKMLADALTMTPSMSVVTSTGFFGMWLRCRLI